MSILTEEQIKQILNEANQVTALYGGGFKPPTKGHFEVVEKALKENPEIDTLKIFVGAKERDGVSQEESVLVWEIYSKYLPMKVEIIPSSKPPIQAIYNYAKENSEEDIYWVIGAREGNEDDFQDIEKRTTGLGKYQNLKLKPIITADGDVSGTNARLALKTRNQEEFNKFIPSQLDNKDKDEVFNILSPSEEIEESTNISEGRYDAISNKISSDIFKHWKENIDQGLVTFENSYEHEGEDIDVEATIKLSPEVKYLNVDGGADDETDFITVSFEVNPDELPGAWSEISFNLKDVIRHEIEHLTHGEGFMLKPGKYIEDDQFIRQMIDSELLPKSAYFQLEKEIDANLQGMYFRAKKEKRPFRNVIDAYLDTQNITPEEKSEIIDLWSKRVGALGLPSIQEDLNEVKGDKILYAFDLDDTLITSQSDIIITNPEKGTFKLTPAEYAVYEPHPDDEMDFSEFDYLKDPKIIKDNFKKFSMVLKKSSQLPNAQTIILTARKPEVAKDLDEFLDKFDLPKVKLHAVGSSDPNDKVKVVQDYIDQGYNKIRFYDDSAKNVNQMKTLNSPEVDVRATLIKHTPLKEILLRENATYSKHIDYKQQIKDLTKHMLQKGMNILPLPKVIFKNGDSENAENFFGKTAYYDPNTQTIVLYTEGRHPKDIVRSFAHEMIHHVQNLEDRLEGITTTNTQEDDHLTSIEAEAYKDGNLTFRGYTDTILNENILPQEKFAQETGQDWVERALHILPHKKDYNTSDYEVKILPVDKIKPTQFGDDYINSSSEYEAEVYDEYLKGERSVEDLRKEDFYPIVVDRDTMEILDGNHRHAVHTMLGIPKIKAILVSKKIEEKKNKDPFGLNQYARELAQGLEEELKKTLIPEEEIVSSQDMDYVIYSDMDGVLTDFEKRFQKFSDGMLPSEYESKYGRDKFWDFIDNQIGVKFWVGMPWMEDGKQYWEYISKYNPILLSAPSINNESRLGKRLWVKKHLPGTPLKLAYAKNKKNYAKENAILIDDREQNIQQWRESGGIGILHTSASDTIKQLKDLGL